jgi:hypothetical protein
MGTPKNEVGQGADLLGLRTILIDSLPPTLLTDEAPDRYTVEAVFTRRPHREEVEAILGGTTRAILSDQGYPTVELSVSDRRLEIANTNLEELRDGLATVLAGCLAEISVDVQAQRLLAAARFQAVTERELARAKAVAALIGSVVFARRTDTREAQPDATTASQIADWTTEGGSVPRQLEAER